MSDDLPGKATGQIWQNRIVRYETVDPEQLLANPFNFRIHAKLQQKHLSELLDEIGWVDTVRVNTQTGHVIDGHLRVTLALRHGEPVVPVLWVDLTEEEERAILATFDWITGLAGHDDEVFASLLEGVRQDGLFEFDEGVFAGLCDDLGIYPSSKHSDLDLSVGDTIRQYLLVLEFESQVEQEQAFKELASQGYKCQVKP